MKGVFLSTALVCLMASSASAQTTSVAKPQVKVPVPVIKPVKPTAQAVTTLRREGPWIGRLDCYTGGNFRFYPFTNNRGEFLSLDLYFEWADPNGPNEQPGTCIRPNGMTDFEARYPDKLLRFDFTLPVQIRKYERNPTFKMTTEPSDTGVWMTAVMRPGAYFVVDAEQKGSVFTVTNVDDRPF
ncbi:hypothetical protein [Sphingomicrobium nitratireducens]|uniref:hypothetical protein n=1 Tax=Sphingomicrobium nitratireducens TaxID=2964666 RepID=UPI00223F4639|nr:hypothetical protein [Sphingomicrobium nitratireducens]